MGVLRVKVGGNWVDVGGSADVVWVDPNPPSDPNIEMWYDTDAFSSLPPLSQADVDARVVAIGDPRFVNVSGDTMTAGLTVTGDIVSSGGQIRTDKVFAGSSPVWSTLQIYASSSPANSSAGIGMRAGNTAITLYTGDSLGNNLEVIDATNAAYRPVKASAFTVSSSERIKEDIEPVSVLDKLAGLTAKRYRLKTRPQNFREVDGEEVVVDHDCGIDGCLGTADSPCCLTANDTPEFGLIAEEVYEVFPEAVRLDADLQPDSIDVNQIAGLALGAVAELNRQLIELRAEVATLKAAT